LYTRLGTTSSYSTVADLHNLQITTAPVKPFLRCCIFTSCSLATASNSGNSSVSVLTSLLPGDIRQLNYSGIYSQPPLLISTHSLLELSWLYLLGTDHIENTFLLLLHPYSLPHKRVYRCVAQKRPLFIRLYCSRCYALQYDRSLATFRRNVVLPSSDPKSKSSKNEPPLETLVQLQA
jgi:hypothetical protein